ncbi:bacteriocin immunity protein [Kribbella sp. NBC_01505]|uniref:bacteriocin immunity protein n=1 Tax=Kribbella sp. NBC_01505 TaxID=2903580 RepID=UPI00386E3A75
MIPDRVRLVELVRNLSTGFYLTEAEGNAALAEFEAAVPHPRASDLIFYWDDEFDHQPTADEVVDKALSYRAIEL